MLQFFRVFGAEWLKKKGSMAAWLVMAGAFFIPLISMLTYLVYPERLMLLHEQGADQFWEIVFKRSWNAMTMIFLPMGIVLATSLICQLEYKNNAWKQVHTAPVTFSALYFSKLLVILVMLLQVFVLFNIGMYLAVLIPSWVHAEIPYPGYPIPWEYVLRQNLIYFYVALPMVLLQYIMGLLFRNFIVPVGIGLAIVVAGIVAISWQYNYYLPSLFPALHYFVSIAPSGKQLPFDQAGWTNMYRISTVYSLFLLVAGYVIYLLKPQKG